MGPKRNARPIPYWPIPAEKERYNIANPIASTINEKIISRLLSTHKLDLHIRITNSFCNRLSQDLNK